MSQELVSRVDKAVIGLSDKNGDIVPTEDRIVIFGSNMMGAAVLGMQVQELFERHGVQNPRIDYGRQVERIADTFYGRAPNNPNALYDPNSPATIPRGVIALLGMDMTTQGVDDAGRQLRVEMPVDDIAELCDKHDVPLVRVEKGRSPAEAMAQDTGAIAARDIPQIER